MTKLKVFIKIIPGILKFSHFMLTTWKFPIIAIMKIFMITITFNDNRLFTIITQHYISIGGALSVISYSTIALLLYCIVGTAKE